MKKIGLICYETQYSQLCNMIQNDEYHVKKIKIYNKGSRIFRFISFIIQILSVDYIYYGYGEVNINWKMKLISLFKKKMIMHWIGTDVINLSKNKAVVDFLNKNVSVHLACAKNIKDELETLGINAIELPIIPAKFDIDKMKAPQKHAALFYLPDDRERFYGIEYLKLLSDKFDKVDFYVVGNTKYDFNSFNKNVINMGRISKNEMDELYKKISILVRIPEHDGLSLMLLEALLRGKDVFYTYEYPYAIKYVDNNDLVKQFKNITDKAPKVNIDGRNYVLKSYNIEDIKNKLYNIFVDVLGSKDHEKSK